MITRLRYLCVSCACLFLLAGCGASGDMNSDFTIRVSGTDGLKFRGHYSIVGNNALPEPLNVQGVVPLEYKGKGIIALCYFRKITENGSLKVEIFKDGKVVSKSETSIPYGFVSLKTPMPETNTMIAQLLRKVLGGE